MTKIDGRNGKVIEEYPQFLSKGEVGEVKLIPQKPLCVERYREFPELGRFFVKNLKETAAVGVIKDFTPKKVD